MVDQSNVTVVEVFEGEDGMFYFHGKAGNGEIVAESEAYTRKSDALEAGGRVFPAAEVKELEA